VLGQHVQVNLDCTIAGDTIIDDFSTLSPGVHIQGPVHMGRRVFVGVGAVIANRDKDTPITIGDDSVIGAGACVTETVAPGVTVVGVPAIPLRRHE
jgi:acetyltransferase-like isoleucine patch superfamily enzyme